MASSVSVGRAVCLSVDLSCLSPVCILQFFQLDSRDDAYEIRLSLIAAHMQRRVFHTHTHMHSQSVSQLPVLAAIVSTLDALRDWSSVCISITEQDNWSRAPIEIYMCSPRFPIPRLPYLTLHNQTVSYPTVTNPTLVNSCPVVSSLSL